MNKSVSGSADDENLIESNRWMRDFCAKYRRIVHL
jgi:hypothetical protein